MKTTTIYNDELFFKMYITPSNKKYVWYFVENKITKQTMWRIFFEYHKCFSSINHSSWYGD